MVSRRSSRPTTGWRSLVLTVFVVVGLVALSGPALALDARVAHRSCGDNWIHSWNSGGGHAETSYLSGSCNSRLSVAWINGGTESVRHYGTNDTARLDTAFSITGGVHWGCDSCSRSIT